MTLVAVQIGVAAPVHSSDALTPATIYHPSRSFGRTQEHDLEWWANVTRPHVCVRLNRKMRIPGR